MNKRLYFLAKKTVSSTGQKISQVHLLNAMTEFIAVLIKKYKQIVSASVDTGNKTEILFKKSFKYSFVL